MGKLTSIILGVLAAEVLAYYLISSEYSTIINWFGPVLGFRIVIGLGLLALFFGSPFGYAAVAASWIAIGFFIALGSRKTLRAIGSAIAVFAILIIFFALAIYSLLVSGLGANSLGSILSSSTSSGFPPPPPGSSVGQVLTAPVISSLVGLLTPALSAFGISSGAAGGFTLSSVLTTLFLPLIENFIILLLSAGVFAYLLSRFVVEKRWAVRRGGSKSALSVVLIVGVVVISMFSLAQADGTFSGNGPASQAQILDSEISNQDIMGLANVSGYVPNWTGQPAATSSSGYYEGIISYVSGDGSVYNGYGFALSSNSSASSSFYNMPGINSSILTALVGSTDLANFFLGVPGLNVSTLNSISKYLNLVPQEILIQLFPGNLSESSSLASQGITSAGSGLSMQFNRVLALSIPANTTASGYISIYLYTAGASYQTFLTNFRGYSVSGFHNDGLIKIFDSNLNNHTFYSGQASLEGSVVFSAFINFNVLSELSGTVTSLGGIANGSKYLSVLAGFSVDNYAFHSTGASTNVTLADTLGYSGNIAFASDSSGSLLALGIPSLGSNSTLIPGVNFTVYLKGYNLTSFGSSGISVSGLTVYNATSGVDPKSVKVQTGWAFPPDISVSVQGYRTSGGKIEVNTTVKNNGSVPIYHFSLNSSTFQDYYGNYTSGQSGSLEISSLQLAPGAILQGAYTFTPTGVGDYVIWNMTEQYSAPVGNGSQNVSFNIAVPPTLIHVAPPFFLNAYNQVGYDSIQGIGNLVNFTALAYPLLPGFYLFDLIIALIVALDIYIEVRAFQKAQKKKSQTEGKEQ